MQHWHTECAVGVRERQYAVGALGECVCRRMRVQRQMYEDKRLVLLQRREEHNLPRVCKKTMWVWRSESIPACDIRVGFSVQQRYSQAAAEMRMRMVDWVDGMR